MVPVVKINSLDRILLLITGLLAAYQVAIGIDGHDPVPTIAYTIAFGVLLIAGLLIIILGFAVLDSPVVVIVSTLIPLSLSLGLVWEYLTAWRNQYLWFAIAGFVFVLASRLLPIPGKTPVIVLMLVHGVAGMIVFLLPSIIAAQGHVRPGFALVGLGGALIGLGGLLLSFLKTGRPILTRQLILRILPALLLLTTLAFVLGFIFT
jgi:hypothetical protein